ncbi:MAG: hypothetical protein ABI836_14915 [Gemmatimonadota bacterium]
MRVYTRIGRAQDPRWHRWLLLSLLIGGSAGCRDGNGLPEGSGLDLVSVSAGNTHTCGMAANGFGYCWGDNLLDQLGSKTGTSAPAPELILLRPLKLESITAGGDLTCGTITSGAVYCWGETDPTPMRVQGSESLNSLSVGAFACMLNASGEAMCWDGGGEAPKPVQGGQTYSVLQVGYRGCGLTATHETWCWDSPGDAAIQIGGGILFDSLSVGGGHACGLTSTGQAWCWGNGTSGQLGNFMYGSSSTPQQVSTALSFRSIAAGGTHTCAIATTSDAYCWGNNTSGQLGYGGAPTSGLSIPAKVHGTLQFATIIGGGSHTCGSLADRTVYCWGKNNNGAVGDGSLTTRTDPTLVADQ